MATEDKKQIAPEVIEVEPVVAAASLEDEVSAMATDLLTSFTALKPVLKSIGLSWKHATQYTGYVDSDLFAGTPGSRFSIQKVFQDTRDLISVASTGNPGDPVHFDACTALATVIRNQEKANAIGVKSYIKAIAAGMEAFSVSYNAKKFRKFVQPSVAAAQGVTANMVGYTLVGAVPTINNQWLGSDYTDFAALWKAAMSEEFIAPLGLATLATGDPNVLTFTKPVGCITPTLASALQIVPTLVTTTNIVITSITYEKVDGTTVTLATSITVPKDLTTPISLLNGAKTYKNITAMTCTGGSNTNAFMIWTA